MILIYLFASVFAANAPTTNLGQKDTQVQPASLNGIVLEYLNKDPKVAATMENSSSEAIRYTIDDAIAFLKRMGATPESLKDPAKNAEFLSILNTWLAAIKDKGRIPVFCKPLVEMWAQKACSGNHLPAGWLESYEKAFNRIVDQRDNDLFEKLTELDKSMWQQLSYTV